MSQMASIQGFDGCQCFARGFLRIDDRSNSQRERVGGNHIQKSSGAETALLAALSVPSRFAWWICGPNRIGLSWHSPNKRTATVESLNAQV